MRVLSIDPGETTAFIAASIQWPEGSPLRRMPPTTTEPCLSVLSIYKARTKNPFKRAAITVHKIGQWKGMDQLLGAKHAGLFGGIDVFVVEDYRVYPNRANKHIGSQVYTAKEIGRIEWIAHLQGTEVVLQAASMAKQRWPNGRVRDHINNYLSPEAATAVLKRDGRHVLDALRHLWTFFERNGGDVV